VLSRLPTVRLRERIRNIEHIDLARSRLRAPLRVVVFASIFVGIAPDVGWADAHGQTHAKQVTSA
jgi:hypothetical protein